MKLCQVLLAGILCCSLAFVESTCPQNVVRNAVSFHNNCTSQVIAKFFGIPSVKYNDYLKKQCNSFAAANITKCNNQFESALSYCANTTQKNLLKSYKNATLESVKFMCRKSGAELIDFFNHKGQDCLMKTGPYISNCIYGNPIITMFGNYTKEFCSKSSETLSCIYRPLGVCDARARNFLNSCYQSIRSSTPCAKMH